jgi:ABC-type uncharacterized transport system permease subunit
MGPIARLLFFLKALFHLTPQLAGWTETDVMVSFVFTVLLSGLVDAITPSIRTFVSYAHTGRLEPYLVQPVDPRILMLSRWIRPGSLIVLACIAPLAGAMLFKLNFHTSLLQVVIGVLALLMGAIIIILTMATWSLTAFVTQRVLPTEYILRQIMRLSQLPPGLFGSKFLIAILLFLPVVLTSTVPAMIIVRNEFHLFLPLLASLIIVCGGFVVAFQKTLKRFNGTGG